MMDQHGNLITGYREPHSEKCRACDGTGVKRAKANLTEHAPQPEKPREVFNVRIPKAEIAFGERNLREQVEKAGAYLYDELGYTSKTPPYYVLTAVLHDWLG